MTDVEDGLSKLAMMAQEKKKEPKPVEPGTKLRHSLSALVTGESFVDVVERLADFAAENPVPEGELVSVFFNPIYGEREILGYTASVSFREYRFSENEFPFEL